MAERYKIIPEVFVFFVREGKILLARRFQTGYEDGNYGLPAGHGENGETMRQGAIREALEEVGVALSQEDMTFALVQHRWCEDPDNPHARVGFYFAPAKWSDEPRNTEPEKCDDLNWFPLDALPDNMVPHVRAAIESYKKGERYAEFDWESRK